MAQKAKFIDLSRTYLPIDPNMLPQTMHDTGGEDRPEERHPVVPFEGWNFMPTGHGWQSYFGLAGKIGVNVIATPARCRDVFVFQREDLANVLFALCDDGIWTKAAESAGAWTQSVVLVDPNDGAVREWSHCILENVLYIYRQAAANIWSYSAPGYAFTANVPTTLNMAGQLGIFKAGGRLGIWDSANAVGFSAFEDKMNFTPDIGTQANITKITALVGKITNIVQHGDGFIVYGTRSVIGVVKHSDSTFLWQTAAVSTYAGIAYRGQVAVSAPDSVHFAWTSLGLLRIENFKAEVITPEFYDYLKESQSPVYLKVLEGRYVFVQVLDAGYIEGTVSFYTQEAPRVYVTLTEARAAFTALPNPAVTTTWPSASAQNNLSSAMQTFPAHYAVIHNQGDCALPLINGFCQTKSYGHYVDNYALPVSGLALDVLSDSGNKLLDTNFTRIPITFNGLTKFVVGSVSPLQRVTVAGVATYTYDVTEAHAARLSEENDRNFFSKCRAIWDAYNIAANNYITALTAQLAPLGVDVAGVVTYPTNLITVPKMIEEALVPEYPAMIAVGIAAGGQPTAVIHYLTAAEQTPETIHIEIPHDFEYEFGITGYTYYFIARNRKLWKKDFSKTVTRSPIPREPSATAISIQFVSSTGTPGAGIVTSTVTLRTKLGVALARYPTLAAACNAIFTKLGPVTSITDTSHFPGINAVGTTLTLSNGPATSGTYGSFFHVSVDGGAYSVELRLLYSLTPSVTTGHNVTTIDEATAYCADRVLISYSHPSSFYEFNSDGLAFDVGTAVPAYSEAAVLAAGACALERDARTKPLLAGMSLVAIAAPDTASVLYAGNQRFTYLLPEISTAAYPAEVFTYPPVSFLMQVGSPTPYNTLWKGAFVYDQHLKRWGKMKADYRQLFDFSPINSTALSTIPYTHFNVNGALLNNAGELRIFDTNPTDSYLKFGKIGNFRLGLTTLEEVRADFRRKRTGLLEVETSLDGRSVDSNLTKTYSYTTTRQLLQGVGNSGRWHNLAFRGQFDLTYLEFRSWSSARR